MPYADLPRLEALFPFPVAVEVALRDDWSRDWLLPTEEAETVGWAVCRRREFAAGRHLARRALVRLGGPGRAALPCDGDRLPCWPAGFSGSISHCDDLCVAVATRQGAGIGIDVERADRAVEEIAPLVCLPQEQAWLERWPGGDGLVTLFSLKESVYKALFPRFRRPFGFHEIEVEAFVDGRCRAVWRGAPGSPLAEAVGSLSVRFLRHRHWVFSGAALNRRSGVRASR